MEERRNVIKNDWLFLAATLVGISFCSPTYALTPDHSAVTLSFVQLASNTFIYNPRTLTWKAVSANGQVVRTGHGSGGRGYCPDIHRACHTPTGTFRIMSKGGPGCRSSRFPVGKGGAPMPYCMFFSKYYAIHGSPEVPNYNASHGCIRVHPRDAHWLSQDFISIGTKVVVKPY